MSRIFVVFLFNAEVYLISGLEFFVVLSKTLVEATFVAFLFRFESSLCIRYGFYERLLPFLFELYRVREAKLR